MSSPTRYVNGVTNVDKGDVLGYLKVPDPTQMHVFFDDFDTYAAGDWTVTTVELGAGAATRALTAGDGGLLLITNDAADNDSTEMQKVGASFTMASGKRAAYKARFKVSDATQSDLLIGIAAVDTTLLGAVGGDGVTDGIFFQKDDGSTTLTCYCQTDTTTGQTSATAGTLANDTYYTVGWAYDGKSAIKVYFNDTHVATLDASSTYLPNADLTPSIAIMNGEAVAKTMTVDYILAAKER